MPPLFPSPSRFRARAESRLRQRRRQLAAAGLLAAATALLLIAGTRNRPATVQERLLPAAPRPTATPGHRLRQILGRPAPPLPLALPPPIQPQALPPHQAWPELPVQQNQPTFTDLDGRHWAWPVLADLAQRHLITGFPDGSFRPAAPMTRVEFAAQLAPLFTQAPALATATAYSDLAPDHWAYDRVQEAVQMGFLSTDPDGAFLPHQPVSRIQVIVALANGLAIKSSRSPAQVRATYQDFDQVPPWATHQLIAATEAGLVVNHPERSQLLPNQGATRAEVAAMLHRALVYTGLLQEVPLPYVVEPPAQ